MPVVAIPLAPLLGALLVVAAIAKTRPIPLKMIGVGEGVDDMRPFRASEFADALIG